jgi:hypothetical protein
MPCEPLPAGKPPFGNDIVSCAEALVKLNGTGSFALTRAELSSEQYAEGCMSWRGAVNGKSDSVIAVIRWPVYGTMTFNVMETGDFPTIWEDKATVALLAEKAKIFGNATGEAVSRGNLSESHVVKPTDKSEILWVAQFLKPDTEQLIKLPLEDMPSAPENAIFRVFRPGSPEDEEFRLATPSAMPFWWKHLAVEPAKLWKKTPESEMTLIGPLEPELGVGDINANVMPTLSLLLMADERDKETDVATLENMPGNDTAAIVSRAAPFTPKVDMTRSSFAATGVDGRMSPRSVQITSELEVGKPDALTEILKNGLL